ASGSWVDLTAPGCEYGMEVCGASYAPPLVAAAVGLLVAAGGVTPQQAMDALRATAVPVSGIAGGRVDVLAAARSLGIIAPAPAPKPKPKPGPATPSPAQSQEIDLEQGMFARTLRRTVVDGKGPMSHVVTRRDA